jgi:hypothetical protein
MVNQTSKLQHSGNAVRGFEACPVPQQAEGPNNESQGRYIAWQLAGVVDHIIILGLLL